MRTQSLKGAAVGYQEARAQSLKDTVHSTPSPATTERSFLQAPPTQQCCVQACQLLLATLQDCCCHPCWTGVCICLWIRGSEDSGQACKCVRACLLHLQDILGKLAIPACKQESTLSSGCTSCIPRPRSSHDCTEFCNQQDKSREACLNGRFIMVWNI
eukprot:1161171-Pelagomonas_calceolata.AAC.9